MKVKYSLTLLIALVSFSCTERLTEVFIDEPVSEEVKTAEPCLVPGEMIVEFTEEFATQVEQELADGNILLTKAGGAGEVFSAIGAVNVRRLYDDGGEWEPLHREAGLHRWYRISYDKGTPSTKASVSLESIPGVVYTEPVRRMKRTAVFNDPYFSKQWDFQNKGTSSGSGYVAGADINVVPVWENYTAGSSNVIVSIVDGGIQMNHPDLADAVVPGGSDGSKNFCTGRIGYTIDADEHGTHVAGTIGAVNNNSKGICGIAGGRDGKGGVRLMSCEIFYTDSYGRDVDGDAYNAMVWGADHGAVISQNSWGYVYDTAAEAKAGGVGAMKSAIDYFIKYAGCDTKGNQRADSPMKGGVVIFAAGNESWPDGWPAEYAPVIAVGACSAKMSRSYYSNYGSWVDICAPGGDAYKDSQIYSTISGSKYGAMQGTSMACPHVSGVAALIVSYFGGPGFTNEMLIERLIGGARTDTALSSQQIGPLVDAYGAFSMGGSVPPDPVTAFTAEPSANSINLTWKVTGDQDDESGKAFGYVIIVGSKQSDFTNLDPRAIPSGMFSKTVEVGDAKVGDSISDWIGDLDFETDYYVAIAAYDYSRHYSALSPVKKVTTLSNNPPVVETSYAGDYNVMSFQTLKITYNIYDPDHHTFAVKFTPGSAADEWTENKDGSYALTITGNKAAAGKYTAKILVSDTGAGSAAKVTLLNVPYVILPNRAPQMVKSIGNTLLEAPGASYTIDVDEYIKDPDGEVLRFEISHTNASVAYLNPVGNTLTVTALNYGLDEVTVKAYDCRDESCETSFKISVRKDLDGVDVYPTSVKDYLYVSSVGESTINVKIISSASKVLFQTDAQTSLFQPLEVDMSSYVRGIYTVIVTNGEEKTVRTIAKISK